MYLRSVEGLLLNAAVSGSFWSEVEVEVVEAAEVPLAV
jgi:hypothetical protein